MISRLNIQESIPIFFAPAAALTALNFPENWFMVLAQASRESGDRKGAAVLWNSMHA
jgi:hypothetical protein